MVLLILSLSSSTSLLRIGERSASKEELPVKRSMAWGGGERESQIEDHLIVKYM